MKTRNLTSSIVWSITILVLMASTLIRTCIYDRWWFVGLWALVAVLMTMTAVRCRMWKRVTVSALHLSILLILLGGLLTMLTGQHGKMKLEPNRPNSHFFVQEQGKIAKETLPFSLTLNRFEIETYPNSSKPKDYVSYLRLSDGETHKDIVISMNHILRHRHYRFYQSNYDNSGNSILQVAHDPWGIGVTYVGYAVLFVALAVMLVERRKTLRAVTISWVSLLVILLVVLYVRMLTRPLMPVLRSPLFSIHISTIVTAYALLLGIVVVGVMALTRPKDSARLERLKAISMTMLYPAVALLVAGIFIGALWANISWGSYWSWDPKETWALITAMVYITPLHKHMAPALQKPINFHIFNILAFISVLMTYFGVNYLLGGMHSYA